jgi:YfiH family protein
VQVADCQAILLYDPIRRVVGNVHSGWRGSIRNIVDRTVKKMIAEFSCVPREMVAAVGPSLGPCCAEFIHFRDEIPEPFWKYKDESDHFDFWAITRDQLSAAGLSEKNIHISQMCTKCRGDLFYSYRCEHHTGRFAVFIGLL